VCARPGKAEETVDLVYVAVSIAFFAVAVLYVRACERL